MLAIFSPVGLTKQLVDILSRLSNLFAEFAQGVTYLLAVLNALTSLNATVNEFKSVYTFRSVLKLCYLKNFLEFLD